jgi:hypothetical protein
MRLHVLGDALCRCAPGTITRDDTPSVPIEDRSGQWRSYRNLREAPTPIGPWGGGDVPAGRKASAPELAVPAPTGAGCTTITDTADRKDQGVCGPGFGQTQEKTAPRSSSSSTVAGWFASAAALRPEVDRCVRAGLGGAGKRRRVRKADPVDLAR